MKKLALALAPVIALLATAPAAMAEKISLNNISNYLNGLSTVFKVGRYIDRVVSTPAGLKFAERLAIYDSEMIPNSIIYPI